MSALNVVTSSSIAAAGTYEITLTGRLTCASFSTADYITVIMALNSGTGSFSGASTFNYYATAAGQVFNVSVTSIFATSGAGPWSIGINLANGGSTATFSAAALDLRVTVIKR
jgi:hypothetical protein